LVIVINPIKSINLRLELVKMAIEIKRQRILRMQDLPDRIGFRPSTIYDLIAKGKFPRPFKLMAGGRAAGWLEATIDDWIASRNDESQHMSKK
tara:strand:- start:530 stop:808 length:279 start_codon:yes stop_codon:yes gene_type:complete